MGGKGASWIEMAMDFEIATRVTLTGKKISAMRAGVQLCCGVTQIVANLQWGEAPPGYLYPHFGAIRRTSSGSPPKET